MNNRNRWNEVCRLAAVVLVCVVLVGQVRAQSFRGESGELVLGLGTLECAAYSHDGKYVATGGGGGVFLWNTQTGALTRRFSGHTEPVLSVAFSSDARELLTGSWKEAKLWDIHTGLLLGRFSSEDMGALIRLRSHQMGPAYSQEDGPH